MFEDFSFKYSAPRKNIDDGVTYILNTMQKSGCNGFANDEIFSMAVHYYDEDNIKTGKEMNIHVAELTAEEKEQARQDAIQNTGRSIQKDDTACKKTKKVILNPQLSLFDF